MSGWAGGRGRGWGGRFRSPIEQAPPTVTSEPAHDRPAHDRPAQTAHAQAAQEQAAQEQAAPAERIGDLAAVWAPTLGRILLGLVLAWFGYHELLLPGEWTGYVPLINETSDLAIIAVLAHGWVLLVLAAALVAGIAPRVSAAIASVVLLEIVVDLSVSGLSDTSLRDLGVLGLAICLIGCRDQRLVLRG